MTNLRRPRFIPLAARKVVLRTIIISSLSSFLISLIYGVPDVQNWLGRTLIGLSIIPFAVLLHHILRLWPRKAWSVRSDFIYSIVEFIAVTGCVIGEVWDVTYMVPIFIPILAFFWFSVAASFVFTIWDLHVSRYREMGRTYYFRENDHAASNGRRNLRLGQWTLLFGESTFRRRFGLERMFTRGFRAVIAILCLLAMVALVGLVFLVQPFNQQLYLQTLRGEGVATPANMTVQVTVMLDFTEFGETPDLTIAWRPESEYVPCDYATGPNQVSCYVPSPFTWPSPDSFVLTINYTRVLHRGPVSSLRTGVYLTFNPGPEHGSEAERWNLGDALPTQLYPGFHLFGMTFYSFMETYAGWGAFFFGIPHFNQRLVGNVQAIIPDPEYSSSIVDNTTATLRLAYRGGHSTQSEYRIQREQSGSTVLSGLALLGGAWTFINGLFAAIFGCTLLLVLFGIKPLSIYGLVHLFQHRKSLANGGYILSVEDQSRTVSLLREHLLDRDDDPEVSTAPEEQTEEGQNEEGEQSNRPGDVA